MTDYVKELFQKYTDEFEDRFSQMKRYKRKNKILKDVGIIELMDFYHIFSDSNYCAGWLYDNKETEREFVEWFKDFKA